MAANPYAVIITGNGMLVPTPPVTPPATLAASAAWQSGIIPCGGVPAIAASAQLTTAGTLTIQRYIDPAGTVLIGAAITQALAANTLGYAWNGRDGLPAASFQVTLTNTSGGTATITSVNLLETA